MNKNLFDELINPNKNKMLLIVLDGLGGLQNESGKTELETAHKPNLDKLSSENETGDMIPIDIGITPGSGPGHLGLFGYEPTDYIIGRGILEALGLEINVDKNTVTVRCNFATMEKDHVITDRRAGRISSEENHRLVEKLKKKIKSIEGKQIEFYTGKEHRFVLVIRNIKGSANVNDTDPQETGRKPIIAISSNRDSEECAEIINKVYLKIVEILKDELKANTVLFRGISKMPDIPTMQEKFKINPCCIATYPMYKGLATLVGMDILKTKETILSEVETLKENYDKYDFFFFHVKKTDSYGEDGNFDNKVKVIEEFDSLLPEILKMKFEVIAITADHSTPSVMMSHSYHPVPLLFISKHSRMGDVKSFSERECLKGSIKRIFSKQLMSLMLAASGRLKKFGA